MWPCGTGHMWPVLGPHMRGPRDGACAIPHSPYSPRNSSSSALNSAGRSSIATCPVSSKIDLSRAGDQLRVEVRVAHGDHAVAIAPHDQGGADDLGEAVAEVVVEVRLQRLEEARLAGAADLLGHERGGQPTGVAGDEAEDGAAQPGAAGDRIGVGGDPARLAPITRSMRRSRESARVPRGSW